MPVRRITLTPAEAENHACGRGCHPLKYFHLIDVPDMTLQCALCIQANIRDLYRAFACGGLKSGDWLRRAFNGFAGPLLEYGILTADLLREINDFVLLVTISARLYDQDFGWATPSEENTIPLGPFWTSAFEAGGVLFADRQAFWLLKLKQRNSAGPNDISRTIYEADRIGLTNVELEAVDVLPSQDETTCCLKSALARAEALLAAARADEGWCKPCISGQGQVHPKDVAALEYVRTRLGAFNRVGIESAAEPTWFLPAVEYQLHWLLDAVNSKLNSGEDFTLGRDREITDNRRANWIYQEISRERYEWEAELWMKQSSVDLDRAFSISRASAVASLPEMIFHRSEPSRTAEESTATNATAVMTVSESEDSELHDRRKLYDECGLVVKSRGIRFTYGYLASEATNGRWKTGTNVKWWIKGDPRSLPIHNIIIRKTLLRLISR